VVDVFAGPTFSFFKTERQEVFSCGMNDCLQLGIDRALKVFQKKKYLNRTIELNRRKVGEQEFSKPRKIDMFSGQFGLSLIQLECGENHCLALVRYMGQEVMLMGWGLNRHYQIEAALPETTTPRTLEAFYALPITHICCGSTFSLATIGTLLMTDQELEQLLVDALVSAGRL
jgi:alpha-tubulin suppressor-like RCC1 family protein